MDDYGLPVSYRELKRDDDYRMLLRELWAEREDVVIVEHDVVPWPGSIEELWQCPCAWGTYSYRMHGGIGIAHGFGCAKLTTRLMDAVPDVWEMPGMWNVLDQRLFYDARGRGIEPHMHRPPVTHLSRRHAR